MQLSHDDEALLWWKFKNDDRDAFATLYQKHIIPLIAYGSKLCPDRDQLKDQIQELFVELWSSRKNLADTSSVRFYLLKALRYKLIRLEKNRQLLTGIKRFEEHNADTLMEDPVETSIVEKELHESYRTQLKVAMGHLTPRQQEIIQLRFYQGFTHEQIAGLMDLNYQSVSNLLHIALCRLKEQIKVPVLALIFLIRHLA
jgi:RNA polymerase sigma factor (sigma-70 family)